MRILLALGEEALSHRGAEATAATLATVAVGNEVIVTHGYDLQSSQALELALRNALPGRDVVSVLTQVVVAATDPALRDGEGYPQLVRPPKPQAIAEIRSLRTLLDAGALVICARRGAAPLALDDFGRLDEIEAAVDGSSVAALLARRVDADLLVMLAGDGESVESGIETAGRFAEATGCRAAIGGLQDAVRIAGGEAGIQIPARGAGRSAAVRQSPGSANAGASAGRRLGPPRR
ncbi:MAG TPA: hypothetical protein VFM51_02285 [Solirubrobacterales bacterium]|nr:hypothetical protein [Solirubrobacterales bacterium]